ncbi:MAG: tRNA 2-thiocytidine(32) synthetase TtcA, partial [Lentisphaeria bacterium]|nr:tRNA 2-thiocytidine(32) synthetase TtcA [Lentisphaeria bacterium]
MADDFSELCRREGEAVVKYRMIAGGDRILVGASGGKDSFILLHVLEHLRQVAPVEFTFSAATFDPGYPEFDAPRIAEYCRAHGWEHKIVKLDIAGIIAE